MPHEFADMQEVSLAARFRVMHREASATGGLRARAAVSRLDALLADTCYLYRSGRWRHWFRFSYYHNQAAANDHYRQLGITITAIEEELAGSATRPHTRAQANRLAHGVQRAARLALSHHRGRHPELRLRAKLEKWQLPLFPRLRAMRAVKLLERLPCLVPPRVLSAILRTWFNGWCTKRRFQQNGF